MLIRASSGSGGGGYEVLYGDVSDNPITVNWDFDAEALWVLLKSDGTLFQVFLVDVATKTFWQTYALSGGQWAYHSTQIAWTITPRSISYTHTGNVNIFDVIPLKNKPEGYFT